MIINDYIKEKRDIVDYWLEKYLPLETDPPELIHKAMRYSIFAGGKRFRPVLILATGETLGLNQDELIEPACAIECIHTYSLIHDDLPCIDNDDYRRGKLTNHKVFGEAIAVLAGDALLTIAYKILSHSKVAMEKPSIGIKLIEEISNAIGTKGMIGGQVLDISYEKKAVSEDDIMQMEYMKTARLIQSCVKISAIISEANDYIEKLLSDYGKKIGIAFQIIDDLLDVKGNREQLGKSVGKDAIAEKATLCSLLGYDIAMKKANDLINEAIKNIKEVDKYYLLSQLGLYILNRLEK